MSLYPVPSREELAILADEELGRLASEWRAFAQRGEKGACGVAHTLEVELRHRVTSSSLMQAAPEPQVNSRSWWKFCQSGPSNGPLSRA